MSITTLFTTLPALLWSLLMIALFFGGSIFVHELGHFLAARRRGVKVERFSIGFGPRIFSRRGKDGVEYRLSWLPLGGYVALPQLADMRSIEGEPATEAEAELRKLPPPGYGTKMLVFVAGAACNLLFAFVLACILWQVGTPANRDLTSPRVGYVLPTLKLPDGTEKPSPAAQAGLQAGDYIRAIDGIPVNDWSQIQQTIFTGTGRAADKTIRQALLTVERDGRTLQLTAHPLLAGDEQMRMIGITPYEEFLVAGVKPGTPAATAGLHPGDRLVSINDTPVYSGTTYVELLRQNPDAPATLRIQRATTPDATTLLALTLPARAGLKNPLDIGVAFDPGLILVHTPPHKQFANILRMTWRTVVSLLSPSSDVGISKLSGPVGIAHAFHLTAQADIRLVVWLTILLNINLAIFNLLPIPVLDGGHMLFATLQKLRGRPLPVKLIMNTQVVFMALLLTMILYVSFFDTRRVVRDVRSAPEQTTVPRQD
ncbi:MAG: RIP metalloprotease RseP [Opitutaceae bacterium]|nr:RIP metalloprotease RseP [Opitutaceae bacterium]